MTPEVFARFEKFVMPEPNSGCWLWIGAWSPQGYGRFRLEGETQLAHRLSYQHHVGEITSGLEIDHLCRVRCCINTDHLEVVTGSVNSKRGAQAAFWRGKTHCPFGHAYEGNCYFQHHKNGVISRICKICAKRRAREWKARARRS